MRKKLMLKLKTIFSLFCLLYIFNTIACAQHSQQSQDFSEAKKMKLIRSLLKKRIYSDPYLKQRYINEDVPRIEDIPETALIGLPEGTIVTIVETYWMKKKSSSLSDKEILEGFERLRKNVFPRSGRMPSPLTLSNHIKYRLKIEHSEGHPLSDKFIDEAIEEANKAYH